MIVVADTTPLNYLVLIDEIEVLPALYQRVLVPEEVHRELTRQKSPPAVHAWASNLPAGCEVRAVASAPARLDRFCCCASTT
jgi:predicted nucleic acid-binding protein